MRRATAMTATALALVLLQAPAQGACPPLLDHRLPRLQDEKPVDLCAFTGKVLLVVNTASQCGYTPQYRSLEALYRRYAARGLVVLGFPSNEFGAQEPGDNSAIAEFCENHFAVRFPMFAKSIVQAGAPGRNPLYAALAKSSGATPRWNFHKYLVSRDASHVLSHPSAVDPLDPRFVRDLERLLGTTMN